MTAKKRGAGLSAQTPFRKLQEQLKLADIVFELRDARAPQSTGHPAAAKLFGNLPRIIVLSHLDLANAKKVKNWIASLPCATASGATAVHHQAIAISLKHQGNKDVLIKSAKQLAAAGSRRQGVLPRAVRACVVGLPNTGKSSLINWILGRRKAAAGNKPGITRAAQWIRIGSDFELLDTPGILPPSGFDEHTSKILSILNLLARYESEEIATWAIQYLSLAYPNAIKEYGIDTASHIYVLEQIAVRKNFRAKNNFPDCLRAADAFIHDLRAGVLGRLYFDAA